MTALLTAPLALSPVPAQAATPGGVVQWSWSACIDAMPQSINSGVVQAAIYGTKFAALKADGSVVGWGGASIPSGASTGVVDIYGSNVELLAAKADGSVVSISQADNTLSTVLAPGSGATAVRSGPYAGMALTSSGSVVSWGTAGYGGNAPASVTNPGSGVTSIGSGLFDFYAVKNGGVVAWGYNGYGASTPPSSASSGVVAVTGGDKFALALKSDGSVIGWGKNQAGQITIPAAASSGVVAIEAQQSTSWAVKSDGSVIWWGETPGCNLSLNLPQSGMTALSNGVSDRPRRHLDRGVIAVSGRHPDVGADGLQTAGHGDPGRLLRQRQQHCHPQHPNERRPGRAGGPRRPCQGGLEHRVGLAHGL